MRQEGLPVTEVRETVYSQVGRQQVLDGSAHAHEIGEFIYRVVLEDEHEPA